LNGSYEDQIFQVGANKGQTVAVTIASTAWGLTSLDSDGSVNSVKIGSVDDMINDVSKLRSQLGAIQNRFEYTVKVDDNSAENLQSAESRIRDTDMADEMTRYSKESILQQAATSMLAQANQANQGVLSLLG
jgi:flagellin